MKTIDLEPDVTATEAEIADMLQMPSNFALFREADGDAPKINHLMGTTWSLGPVIRHRDSPLIDESNAAVLLKLLEGREDLKGEWRLTGCGHDMVGWVDHLSFHVLDAPGGTLTRMAKVMIAWHAMLRSYPVADQGDLDQRTEASMHQWVEGECRQYVGEKPPATWVADITKHLYDEYHNEIADAEDGCVGIDILLLVLVELDLLDDHHKAEFLELQLNILKVLMEWGAQTLSSLQEELKKATGSMPRYDHAAAALTRLQRMELVAIITRDRDEAKIRAVHQAKWGHSSNGDIFVRR